MAKVDTNTIGLKYADESTAGEAPSSGYVQMEPNEIGAFGATLSTTPREPISINRQRRKGAITDLEAAVSVTEDLTFSAFRSWIEAAVFAKAFNGPAMEIPVDTVDGGNNEYDFVTALTADQDDPWAFVTGDFASLVWAEGFDAPANNGLKTVDGGLSSGDNEMGVTDNLTNASNQDGYVSFAGLRILSGHGKAWAWDDSAKTATLTATAIGGNTAGGKSLQPGMYVHVGSIANAGDDDLQNGISATGFGYCRVKTVNTGSIVFDRVATLLQEDVSNQTSSAIDLVYGEFIRNIPSSHDDFLRRSRTLELESPDLGDVVTKINGAVTLDTAAHAVVVDSNAGIEVGDHLELGDVRVRVDSVNANGTGLTVRRPSSTNVAIPDNADVRLIDDYEYAVGNLLNTMTLNLPLTDKATMALAFVGTDVKSPDQQEGQSGSGAVAAARSGDGSPRKTEPFNTTADFARLRVTEVDEDGLTTDFKSVALTINNNLTGEKVLGFLGNKFVNTGNLFVDIETQVIFSSPRVVRAIRDNDTLKADMIIGNGDGVIAIDIPSLTLGGGGREYPVNQAVLVNATVQAFADADLDTSLGISVIHVPIPTE